MQQRLMKGRAAGTIALITKVIVAGVTVATLGALMFAVTMEDNDSGMPYVNRVLRPKRSPGPVVKPAARPPYREYLGDDFNLRKCECRKDWKELPKDSPGICRCRGICPAFVTPVWLTEAAGQALCSLEETTGYNCYADCLNEKAEVGWFATPCGGPGQEMCEEPILATRKKKAEAAKAKPAEDEAAKKKKEEEERKKKEKAAEEERKKKEKKEAEAAAKAKLDYDPKEVYDLRGLKCEELNGKSQCFYEDAQGRELCPDYVTPQWLTEPPNQYLCSAEMAHLYYCTVGCQEGNKEVRWGAHEIAWCNTQGKGGCPERHKVYPRKGFKLGPWTGKPEEPRKCRDDWEKGVRPARIKDISVGMLTHEPKSMKDSLETYDKLGLFDVFPEFMVYVNKRRPEIDDVLAPFIAKYPGVIKVMGDENNYGIARGINFLTGNATHDNFLFLERDFQLIEPATCIVEQMEAGKKVLASGKAHVVRFRHRRHPGRPNWAEKMYKGHEDDVFKSGQPNLFCNHYYWVNEPEKRWPDKMWECLSEPTQLLCSDSYYCNWTNNPQLWSVKWWKKEYVDKFDSFSRNDPYYDLEMYMNWEPNSWNTRKFIVAQGEGLFKHVDRNNFGT